MRAGAPDLLGPGGTLGGQACLVSGRMPSGMASAPCLKLQICLRRCRGPGSALPGGNELRPQLLITPLRPSPWLEAVELWEMLLDTLGPGPWSHPLRASGPRRSEADFRQYHPRLLERGYQIMLGSILLPPELGGSCAPQGGHMAGEPGQGPTMPPSGWVSESPS